MAEKKSEDLQRELIETQLETARISLEQQKDQNAAYQSRKRVAAATNAQRQAQLAMDRSNLRAIQMNCQHSAGGEAGGDPTQGGGKFAFSVLTQAIMPDGKTVLVQCPRCRLKLYGRELNPREVARLEKSNPEKYADHIWWKELMKVSKKEGTPNNVMRGPTFMFEKDGVNFIPEMV